MAFLPYPLRPPRAAIIKMQRLASRPSPYFLAVNIAIQRLRLFTRDLVQGGTDRFPTYIVCKEYVISTSRFGAGQIEGSNQTPLGLHRVARKIGAWYPIGTVFKSRRPVGFTWQGKPTATIAHRILWLEGLEPGFNSEGEADTFRRYIYIHGFGDEMSLGRPQSHGCIHMAAADLIPLFDQLPLGTLVWIGES